jgi:hypothetical protein
MNQADKDWELWMARNARYQQQTLIYAKETGKQHYINQQGNIVIQEEKTDDKR